ncbi:ABC-F family ATP-binding cassette domain-containing protein [Heyndrickxia oleronia]|uniref:Multidrug ABC transporter ATP-binding protein n=1 Tax=Heyndrickxia oleronia TaxID=38875 RepID=A0A8E2IDA6_9BACI|nr:ABC-F family ATP-binding cassette domain-containing protein [Heyndrickxia oleronia]MEC1377193.1 ABC-F family ATP-binding cassette domain-containing protein [Heyndrickxia oleronia]OOP67816.1 multidrug ABC transporter ATP-binding protein [Heyndrickxia oleronia]QQZ07040.1 ABC-F family ATP-binding cassette domain-containing protein [Heyndrickxia oleronia]
MLLQLNGIDKYYSGEQILSNISMKIEAGERVGLVGVNGAGKSTLLKIIAGEIPYDNGEIHIKKETKIGYLRQDSGLRDKLTIWNEMMSVFDHLLQVEKELRELEGMMANPASMTDSNEYEKTMNRYANKSDWFMQNDGYEKEAKIHRILNGMGFSDISTSTQINTLSGGQKTRLALAKILLQQPDLLILDEPTNHLDLQTLTWLENYLHSFVGTILIVSHDRYFLDSLVSSIYEIERTEARRYVGNYSKYVESKEKDQEILSKKYVKQQEDIAKMENYIQRNIVRATSSKSAKNKRKQLERIIRIDKPLGDLKKTKLSFPIEKKSHKEVIDVKDLALFADKDNSYSLIKNITFQMHRGDKVALIGPNGIGKSTLIKKLVNNTLTSEEIKWGNEVKIGYYDQEQATLNSRESILQEVWTKFPHEEEAKIRTILGNFLFNGEDVFKKISALSGGEKARVALTELMLEKANVLLLDEPTNHLDLFTKEILETALLNYEGTIFFISHDRYFINKVATRILELQPTGVTNYNGNYDDYIRSKSHSKKVESIDSSNRK